MEPYGIQKTPNIRGPIKVGDPKIQVKLVKYSLDKKKQMKIALTESNTVTI